MITRNIFSTNWNDLPFVGYPWLSCPTWPHKARIVAIPQQGKNTKPEPGLGSSQLVIGWWAPLVNPKNNWVENRPKMKIDPPASVFDPVTQLPWEIPGRPRHTP